MQILTILTTFALAATALGSCPNGPYYEGGACDGDCVGAQRCSKSTDHVVRIAIYVVFFSLPPTSSSLHLMPSRLHVSSSRAFSMPCVQSKVR